MPAGLDCAGRSLQAVPRALAVPGHVNPSPGKFGVSGMVPIPFDANARGSTAERDLRRDPLEVRKATLASVLAKAASGLRLNEHIEHEDGATVFRHACKMGLEGIVSKRLGSRYRSGRSKDWLKFKNPEAPAVKREAEEEWGR